MLSHKGEGSNVTPYAEAWPLAREWNTHELRRQDVMQLEAIAAIGGRGAYARIYLVLGSGG